MSINGRLLSASCVVAAMLVTSCDDSPTRPGPPPVTQPGPIVTAAVVSVRIVAPASVAPDTSAQLVVNATRSDGSTTDVTGLATWTSSDPRVLEVAGGLVRSHDRGEAVIQARYQNRSSAASVLVLPEGTFKLTGSVTDSGFGLDGVTVAVIGGTGEGMSALTNPAGSYRFYGVAGAVRLHAKKAGYENRIEDVDVSTHRTANLAMSYAGERPRLEGTYDLTVTATSHCTTLPQSSRVRSYIADVEQDGTRLSVVLSGADFIVTNGFGNRFPGTIVGDRVTFQPGSDGYYYYYFNYLGQAALVERLPPTAVVINGVVSARQTALGLTGQLSGTMGVARTAAPPFLPLTSACYSGTHDFVMTRR